MGSLLRALCVVIAVGLATTACESKAKPPAGCVTRVSVELFADVKGSRSTGVRVKQGTKVTVQGRNRKAEKLLVTAAEGIGPNSKRVKRPVGWLRESQVSGSSC